mmetsp:Transcript_2185/g.4782  ORF Transcript_2185/g.4782 Transcript_2185/m.4782 type:complete len:1096 (-) Transcript_2185:143-3430(-)|eukprot:scaffold1112_cov92-Amphora_coffeaeformis.AAC.2
MRFSSVLFGALLWLSTTHARLHSPSSDEIEVEQEAETKDQDDKQIQAVSSLAHIAVADDEPPTLSLYEDFHSQAFRQFHQQIQSHRSLWGRNADIGIIIDGSDAVSNSEFELLKQGLLLAVTTPAVVPVDGSFGIFVEQFGGNNPVVEFPYRRIETAADVTALAAAINGMSRRGGVTNTGRAIEVATAELGPNQRGSARQIFCMTAAAAADVGEGITIEDAIKAAKRKSWKLDVMSFIAVGANTAAQEQVFRNFFTPLLFDGQLVFSDDLSTYADSVANAAFGYDGDSIIQQTNSPPVVTLIAPRQGRIFLNTESIVLQASSFDAEDGPNVPIFWFDPNGFLTIANSFEVDAADYPLNVDLTFTAFAQDYGLPQPLRSISKSVTIRVIRNPFNNRPQIAITQPLDGSTWKLNDIIPVSALATDVEDGNLDFVVWKLDNDPTPLPIYKTDFSLRGFTIGPGTHTLKAFTQDSGFPGGGSLTSREVTVTFTIWNATQNFFEVDIERPYPFQRFKKTDTIRLTATTTTPGTVIWLVNGDYYGGLDVSIDAIDLPIGSVDIQAIGSETGTLSSAFDLITITIEDVSINQVPVVHILKPEDDQLFYDNEIIPFEASAYDPEDGELVSIQWFLGGVEQGPPGQQASVQSSTLGKGNHFITAIATDSEGGMGSDTVYFQVLPYIEPNKKPTVRLIHPIENDEFLTTDRIHLHAEAKDQDGDATTVLWFINDQVQDTPGENVYIPPKTLSGGTYKIGVQATDSKGDMSSRISVTVRVQNVTAFNTPPSVLITSPSDGSTIISSPGKNIQFLANAMDREEGDISNRIVWFVNDVFLQDKSGGSITLKSTDFGEGQHKIEAFANDGEDLSSATAVIFINIVANHPPIVEIDEPQIQDYFVNEGTFEFVASVEDDEDLDAALDVVWRSDWDGVIGRGAKILVDLSKLTLGPHLITATVTDALGLSDSDSVSIGITEDPIVRIQSPLKDQAFDNEIIDLIVESTDSARRTLVNPDVKWFIVGPSGSRDLSQLVRIGTGPNTSVASFANGIPSGAAQEIFVVVTDSQGRIGVDSVVIGIFNSPRPVNQEVARDPRAPGSTRGIFIPTP